MIEDIENRNQEMKNTLEESEKKKMKRSFEYDEVIQQSNRLEEEYRYQCWYGENKKFDKR